MGAAAIVTGAGGGIGRATAERLGRDGFTVIAVDINADNAEATAATIREAGGAAEARSFDVTDRALVARELADIAAAHGGIATVVHAAMRVIYKHVDELTEDDIDATLAIGLKSAFWMVQGALPHMLGRDDASFVLFSSPAATRGNDVSSIYSAVKGAMASLVLQLAGELGKQGVRVNGVIPGAVPTPGAMAVVDEAGYEARRKANALGRLGQPEDIANGIAFLVSPDASYVNGHLLAVDGRLL